MGRHHPRVSNETLSIPMVHADRLIRYVALQTYPRNNLGLSREFFTPDHMMLSLIHLGNNEHEALKMMQRLTQ